MPAGVLEVKLLSIELDIVFSRLLNIHYNKPTYGFPILLGPHVGRVVISVMLFNAHNTGLFARTFKSKLEPNRIDWPSFDFC